VRSMRLILREAARRLANLDDGQPGKKREPGRCDAQRRKPAVLRPFALIDPMLPGQDRGARRRR
jgi:hypothetical protein